MRNYEEDFGTKSRDMERVEKCFHILRHDVRFHTFLTLFLTFGNFLNRFHKKGKASGFRLKDTLPKITIVKSFSKDLESAHNMIEFIIMYLEQVDPEALKFAETHEAFLDAKKGKALHSTNFLTCQWNKHYL